MMKQINQLSDEPSSVLCVSFRREALYHSCVFLSHTTTSTVILLATSRSSGWLVTSKATHEALGTTGKSCRRLCHVAHSNHTGNNRKTSGDITASRRRVRPTKRFYAASHLFPIILVSGYVDASFWGFEPGEKGSTLRDLSSYQISGSIKLETSDSMLIHFQSIQIDTNTGTPSPHRQDKLGASSVSTGKGQSLNCPSSVPRPPLFRQVVNPLRFIPSFFYDKTPVTVCTGAMSLREWGDCYAVSHICRLAQDNGTKAKGW